MLVIRLFTSETAEEIAAKGGSFAWKLNTTKANLCSYALLYHNARGRIGRKSTAHGAAFLVGRISSLMPQPEGRYAVMFDEVAEPASSEEWPKTHQNPVNYMEVDDGIFQGLKFVPLDHASVPVSLLSPAQAEGGLTIARAKELLAAHYGVSPQAIEITIRG
ncbi:hypothetical protein [Devosia naphthalenivorans]|uniref:hypothetical protein n=1 Tax=Devosia naphthalenivorans TaxID=2082392 RepID=UPI000D37A314|nr:hypothetical protein [Devosia naphthalenivorans]